MLIPLSSLYKSIFIKVEMKELFSGYYRPDEEKFQEIWQSATFVLDANILLNMYRYPKEAQKQLFAVLQKIESRLWVPYQVALEFQRNRLTTISNQKKRFSEVHNILKKNQANIRSELEKLQLKKRHSSIQTDQLVTALDEQVKNFLSTLNELEAKQLSVVAHDPIREKLDQLLEGKVGEPLTQEEVDQIYKEGEIRFRGEIPPGYKDQKKENNKENNNDNDMYSYGGVLYKRKYGDLMLWKQIIAKARKDSIQSIVLLTDDVKEDWWWIIDGKKIGPRPELIDEISREAKTNFFHIYNSEQFLKYSKQYLDIQVTDESILQVRDITKEQLRMHRYRHLEIRRQASVAGAAVLRWLIEIYPDSLIYENKNSFPDFIVSDPDDSANLGFEIKLVTDPRLSGIILRDQLYRGYYEVNEGNLDEISFVFVAPDQEVADAIISILRNKYNRLPSGVKFIVGLANIESKDESEGAFQQLLSL